ncbi:MAG: hypothetical protein Q9227_002450 [Pyrenula ochraceoflavens]
MAYNKTFNPDALPAHAEPEEAAQRLSALEAHRRPSNERPTSTSPAPTPPRRISPHSLNPPPNQYTSKPLPSQPHPVQTQHSYSSGYNSSAPNSAQSAYSRLHSPPPQNYGFGPPPPQPSYSPRPAPSPAPPPAADSTDLFPLFRAANASNTGTLSESELGSALVNADYTSFDPHTIRVMMQMFDATGKGSVTYDEFVSLWRFLAAWRELFERFDEDRSGKVSLNEFTKALAAFGYRLSPPFIGVLYNTFTISRQAGRRPSGASGMSFDLFVQACISLKRLTDVFKGYDDDRDGYITMSFEEFLTECLKLREYLVK